MSLSTHDQRRLERVATLYRENFTFVWRVLRRFGVAEGELDDAVQETFLVVYRRLDGFDGRAATSTWLYAIAVRVAATARRSAQRREARREQAGASMQGTGALDPERAVSDREAEDILQQILSDLGDDQRTVFVLADLEGLPIPEIARIVGSRVSTIHSRLRLARQRFDRVLGRLHAQESGRQERAKLVLAARTHEQRPSEASHRASLALLLTAIEGEAATLVGWSPLGWVVGTVSLGVVGVAIVTQVNPVDIPARAPVIVSEADSRGHQTRESSMLNEPSPPPLPISEASLERIEFRKPPIRNDDPAPAEPRTAGTMRSKIETAGSESAAAQTEALAHEVALLEQARLELRRGDGIAALALLDSHAREFPKGILTREREASRSKARALIESSNPHDGLVRHP